MLAKFPKNYFAMYMYMYVYMYRVPKIFLSTDFVLTL